MNNLRDSYKFYKDEYNSVIGIKIYLEIVLGYIQFLMFKVFEGHEIKLPARLGSFYIRGRKVKPRIGQDGEIKGLAPNWADTKKLWDSNPEAKEKKEIVYCFNEHTDGVRYKLIWSKKNVNVKNKMIYSIRFSRDNKREVLRRLQKQQEYIVY